MKFLELIDELLEYIEHSSNLPLSSKSVIDKIEIIELIKEIKNKIPEEMNKAKWIIKERDRIIREAKEEAESMLNNSGEQLRKLVDEHEITKNAKQKANDIIHEVQNKKTEINDSILEYANDILKGLETNLEKQLSQIKENLKEIEPKKPEKTSR